MCYYSLQSMLCGQSRAVICLLKNDWSQQHWSTSATRKILNATQDFVTIPHALTQNQTHVCSLVFCQLSSFSTVFLPMGMQSSIRWFEHQLHLFDSGERRALNCCELHLRQRLTCDCLVFSVVKHGEHESYRSCSECRCFVICVSSHVFLHCCLEH